MIINPYAFGIPQKYWVAFFASGELGSVFDFTDLASMYTDSAGTVPCTTSGQSVLSIRDKITGGLALPIATPPTTAFDSGIGKWGLLSAGVGNPCSIALDSSFAGNSSKSLLMAAVIDTTAVQVGIRIPGGNGANPGDQLGLGYIPGDTPPLEFYMGGSGNGVGTNGVAVGQQHIYCGTKSILSLTLYDNNTSPVASGSATSTGVIPASPLGYFGDTNQMLFQAIFINRALTSAEVGSAVSNWKI